MLKEIIDKYYLDKEKRAGNKEQANFYVTDAGKCPRVLFFKFKNAPKKEMEANILRLFDHGDYIHKLIMKTLVEAKEVRVVASEVNIPSQELVFGRADAIISDGRNLYVLDIKSINSSAFKYLTKPKEENIFQLQLYLHYFRIPKGILLYVNKDTQELKEFLVDYNQTLSQNLIDDLKSVKAKIDKNIVPARISDYPNNWQCRYCQYREICELAEPGEMEWEKLKERIENRTLFS